jgi:hypothetical protein
VRRRFCFRFLSLNLNKLRLLNKYYRFLMNNKLTLLSSTGALFICLTANAQVVTISGIVDPDYSFDGRAIELYISGTVDLSDYALQRSSNGANNFNTTLSLTGIFTDEFVYVVNTETVFDDAWGTSGDFANVIQNGNVSGNGNDSFRLVDAGDNSIVYDIIGDPTSGTDTWEDGFIYRKDNLGPLPTCSESGSCSAS